ncbi:uncharacterized protein LOC141589865 [Silene latifolia]|uniref:uncharacterized protein LOC141589865 n=1 Tax=Silene latifolia TaxID=37657 RepID=UPI003D78A42E
MLIVESCAHLFRDCPYANKIWAGSILGIRAHIGKEINIQSWIINWLSLIQKLPDWESSALSFLCSLWTIWGCQCKKIFQKEVILPYGAIKVYEFSYNMALKAEEVRSSRLNPKGVMRHCRADDQLLDLRNSITFPLISAKYNCDQLELFVDDSWHKNLSAGLGWVIKRSSREVVLQGARSLAAQSAEQAEALAIREGLIAALKSNYVHIAVFSDCLQVLSQVLKLNQLHHGTKTIIEDILNLVHNFHCISFCFVPRNCNMVAHRLAKGAIRM